LGALEYRRVDSPSTVLGQTRLMQSAPAVFFERKPCS
jgi:hypothetical protein